MKKFIVLTVMLLATMPIIAYDFEVDGICYNILSVSDLTCEVAEGKSYAGEIVIPSTVTYNGKTLKVLHIGKNAFANCVELEYVQLSDGLETIKEGAFKECTSLKRISIPSSVIELEDRSFSACTSLEDLTLEDAETPIKIGDNGFYHRGVNNKPAYVTDFSSYTVGIYSYCTWGEGLFLQSPLKRLYIGRDFTYRTKYYDEEVYDSSKKGYLVCPTFTPFSHHEYDTVTIGGMVTELYGVTFKKATIQTLNISYSPVPLKIYPELWIDKKTYLSSPDHLLRNSSLERLHIDRTYDVEEHNYSAPLFENISSLEEVVIGDNVSELPRSIFSSCKNLKQISFGKALTSIPIGAFTNCNNLSKVELPVGLEVIGDRAFKNSYLVNIVFNNQLQEIGEEAFAGTNVIEVTLPYSLNKMGSKAFSGCDSLKSVIMNCQLTELPLGCFNNCVELKDLQLPPMIEKISEKAAYGCTSLEQIVIPDNVSIIDKQAFGYCPNLKVIEIGKNVAAIGANAFAESNLAEIRVLSSIPPVVEDQNCFSNPTYLYSQLLVPNGCTSLYNNADIWKNFWNIDDTLPNAIKGIADGSADLTFTSTSDGIALSGADRQSVNVYRITGEEVLSIKNYQRQNLSLPKGIYVIKAGKKALKVQL